MGVEIERKFLVPSQAWRTALAGIEGRLIQQGYLLAHEAIAHGVARSSVRVRRAGDEAWLTIKSAEAGIARQEFEYAIPVSNAARMLQDLCLTRVEKTRYALPLGDHVLEVDVFEGANAGLVVAEVELASVDDAFTPPPWLGPEVSHLPRYFNLSLAEHPYTTWTYEEQAATDAFPRSPSVKP